MNKKINNLIKQSLPTYHFQEKMVRGLIIILLSLGLVLPVFVSGDSDNSEPSVTTKISIRNLSREDTIWYKSLKVEPSDQLLFRIKVENSGDTELKDVMVKASLPSKVIYQGTLKIDDNPSNKNISTRTINIGDLSSGQLEIITFEGKVATKNKFTSGTTNLITTVLAYNTQTSDTASCKAIVKMGTATQVSTGITDGILDSILFPAAIAFLIIWIFKSKLIGMDRIMEQRKREVTDYRAKKTLKKKIKQIQDKIL